MRSPVTASIAFALLLCASCAGPGPTPEPPKAPEPKPVESAAKPAATATEAKPPAGDEPVKTTTTTAPPAAAKVRVIAAGADPKALRTYAFVVNKVDKRIITIAQEQQRDGAAGQGMTLVMHVDFTPKKVETTGTHFDLKVTKLDIPQLGIPAAQRAEVTKALGELVGLSGGFDISARGEPGEVSIQNDPKMQNPLTEGVVQALSQTTEILAPALPDAPIGVGAKWEREHDISEAGLSSSIKATYTLKEVNAEGGLVEVDVEMKVPTREVQGHGAPPGTTVSAEGKGKYTYRFRFDRLATSVKGELTVKQHVVAVDPNGKKQAVDDTQIAKHTIETPK